MSGMGLLDYILPFLLALGILIVVHEFGHYGVARLCGVKVLRFSVGFGKPLLLRRLLHRHQGRLLHQWHADHRRTMAGREQSVR